jgi:hypothetical protein
MMPLIYISSQGRFGIVVRTVGILPKTQHIA